MSNMAAISTALVDLQQAINAASRSGDQQPFPPKPLDLFTNLHQHATRVHEAFADRRFDPLHLQNDALKSFENWIASHNIDTTFVEIRNTKSMGFGLFAKKEIAAGQKIVVVSRSAILTAYSGQEHDELDKLGHEVSMLKSNESLVLSLRILRETSNPKSKWKPYLSILPRSFNLPMLGTPQQLAEYFGTDIIGIATNDFKNVLMQYLLIRSILQRRKRSPISIDNFTLAAWLWARAITITRQNMIPVYADDEKTSTTSSLCLIPLYDLFNHAPGKITTNYDLESQQSETEAPINVSTGDQILISYGSRSNQDLLLYSGFVDPSFTENDAIYLQIALIDNDSIKKDRKTILSIAGFPNIEFYRLRSPPIMETSSHLLMFVRVLNMTQQETHTSLSPYYFNRECMLKYLSTSCNVSVDCEIRSLKWLMLRCIVLKRAISKSLDDDIDAVSKGTASNPAKIRVAEHAVLVAVESEIQTLLQKLSKSSATDAPTKADR